MLDLNSLLANAQASVAKANDKTRLWKFLWKYQCRCGNCWEEESYGKNWDNGPIESIEKPEEAETLKAIEYTKKLAYCPKCNAVKTTLETSLREWGDSPNLLYNTLLELSRAVPQELEEALNKYLKR